MRTPLMLLLIICALAAAAYRTWGTTQPWAVADKITGRLAENSFVQAVGMEIDRNPMCRLFAMACSTLLLFSICIRSAEIASLAAALRPSSGDRLRQDLLSCCAADPKSVADRLYLRLPHIYRSFCDNDGHTASVIAEACTGVVPLMGLCLTLTSLVGGAGALGGPAATPTLIGAGTCVGYVVFVELPARHFNLIGRLMRIAAATDTEAQL